MRHVFWLCGLALASLGLAGCAGAPPGPAAATAAPSSAERLAAIAPDEVRGIMVELDLAASLDRCGFAALGSFTRDQLAKRIESCPNSAERKEALRQVVASAARREQRRADEARAQGAALSCAETDGLTLIKETIPVAQRLVAAAESPPLCAGISEARR